MKCTSKACPVTAILGKHTPGLSTSGPHGNATCTTPSK